MLRTGTKNALGCLYIDDIASGTRTGSGPSLYMALDGDAKGLDGRGESLWDCLQRALQGVRGRSDICGVVARGTGCAAALALAEQLPVDRLVLCAPALTVPRDRNGARDPALRHARRLAAYARRNLSLCVADTLIIGEGPAPGRLSGWSSQCRVNRLALSGAAGDKMYTIREIAAKSVVSRFLRTGELPKTLAQNPEMCIIDG